jgi:hypothetical protein
MWRVAIYGREAPGRSGQARLDRQVTGLSAKVTKQLGWQHFATDLDLDLEPAGGRPGLLRLSPRPQGGSTWRAIRPSRSARRRVSMSTL